MRINEVITEAWRDYIPKFVPAQELDAEKKRKKQQEYVYKQSARFGDMAYRQLEQDLAKRNIRLADPKTYGTIQNALGVSLGDFLKGYTLNFFGSDYSTGNMVKQEIEKLPVPIQLTPGSIKQYLNSANEKYREVLKDQLGVSLRQNAERAQQSRDAIYQLAHGVFTKQIDPTDIPQQTRTQVNSILQNPPQEWKNELAAQQSTEPAQPAQPEQPTPQLAQGVTVLSQEPMVLQVGKKRYYVMDDGLWHEQGNRNPVDSAWNEFLTKQADLATPESPIRVVNNPPVVRPVTTTSRPQPAARPQPTPAEIRQQKQAAATRQVQRQMKPKITVRPGETLDQAMARTRASRA